MKMCGRNGDKYEVKKVMLIAAVMVMAGAFTGCGKKKKNRSSRKLKLKRERTGSRKQ